MAKLRQILQREHLPETNREPDSLRYECENKEEEYGGKGCNPKPKI